MMAALDMGEFSDPPQIFQQRNPKTPAKVYEFNMLIARLKVNSTALGVYTLIGSLEVGLKLGGQ